MAKKVLTLIKLQIPGGQANPAPPVGPALGQHGVNIMEFCKAFNAQTQARERPHHPGRDHGLRGPLVHVHHEDAAGGRADQGGAEPREGLGEPNREKVGRLSQAQLRSIAETKMPDLNARDVEQAMHVIAGTARSMGVEVERVMAQHGKIYRQAREQIDREQAYPPAEAVKLLKDLPGQEVRRDGRGALPPRAQRPPRRPAAPRHADAPERHRQGAARRRLRRGREGEGGRGRRARTSSAPPTWPTKIEGGFDDFDVAIATPGHDGHGRQARPDPRPARQDAEPEDRHGHLRRRQGRARGEGRQARVPHRPRRERPSARSARRASTSGSCSRTTRPSWTRSSAPSRRRPRAATSARSR